MVPTARNISVFCSASDRVDAEYVALAREMGRVLAQSGYDLVYGGGRSGLMGPLAKEVKIYGGRVTSIIPKWGQHRPIWFDNSDHVTLCDDLRTRKAHFEQSSIAFIALPGGFGTLDEMLDVTVLKHIGRCDVPLVYVNHNGFFDHLRAFYAQLFEQRFAEDVYRDMFVFAESPDEAISYIDRYTGSDHAGKWNLRG